MKRSTKAIWGVTVALITVAVLHRTVGNRFHDRAFGGYENRWDCGDNHENRWNRRWKNEHREDFRDQAKQPQTSPEQAPE